MRNILPLMLAVGLSVAETSPLLAANTDSESCSAYEVVGKFADQVLAGLDSAKKAQLESISFADTDPLSRYKWLDDIARSKANAVTQQLSQCQPVDRIYLAIFGDQRWGARAFISSISQRARGESVDLLEPFTGYMIATLNMRAVPGLPKGNCAAGFGPRGADFSPDSDRTWFRERMLMWVRCASGAYMTFLPESGWQKATVEQIEAIRISNPGA